MLWQLQVRHVCSQDGMAVPSSDENDSLTINKELVMTPPLERQFKKPRNKNRRKPSTGHLRAVARSSSQPMKVLVPPLAPKTIEETEVVPSAPPGRFKHHNIVIFETCSNRGRSCWG